MVKTIVSIVNQPAVKVWSACVRIGFDFVAGDVSVDFSAREANQLTWTRMSGAV